MDGRPTAASDLRFRDRGVYLDAADALLLADLHLGRESQSRVEIPLTKPDAVRERVAALLDAVSPATLVLAGDVLHSFESVSMTAQRAVEGIYADCVDTDTEPIAVAGNHDTRLSNCWPGAVRDAVSLADGTVVCHGHDEPTITGDRYCIGHDHPALSIEGMRRPCYLFGESQYRDSDLVVLPAFTKWAGGVELNQRQAGDLQSPLLTDLSSMQPVVWDADSEESLWFPPFESLWNQL